VQRDRRHYGNHDGPTRPRQTVQPGRRDMRCRDVEQSPVAVQVRQYVTERLLQRGDRPGVVLGIVDLLRVLHRDPLRCMRQRSQPTVCPVSA
jgi:hypothetical protein